MEVKECTALKRLCSLLAICISLIITFNAPIVSHAAGRYLFVDVPDDHWAFEAIKNAGEKEWFSGYPDGTFLPDATISRAEAAKVLVSFLRIDAAKTGYSSFYDVDTSAWYAP